MDTQIVGLTIFATGFYDTGRTSVTASVRTHHYDSTQQVGKGLTDTEILYERRAEIFMSPHASDNVGIIVQKALDVYMSYLDLP